MTGRQKSKPTACAKSSANRSESSAKRRQNEMKLDEVVTTIPTIAFWLKVFLRSQSAVHHSDATHSAMDIPSGWVKVPGGGGAVANEGVSVAGSQRGAPLFFETSGNRFRIPVAEDFVPMCGRACCAVDPRPTSRHARCNGSGECPRVGKVVPSCATELSQTSRKRGPGSFRTSISGGSMVVRSRDGLRGVQVGEASDPGPKKRRRCDIKSRIDPRFSIRARSLPSRTGVLWHKLAPTMIQSPESTLVEESAIPAGG